VNRDDRTLSHGLFLLTFIAYAWFFNGGGWNQNAHLDLTRAIVERMTLHVDGYHTNTFDLSPGRGGRLYINKPPGASVLAAIPDAPIHLIERASGVNMDSPFVQTLNAWLITALTCGVTGALIPCVLYGYLRRRFAAARAPAVAVALVMAFGTISFPYSTMLFAHVPSALFLLLAFVWLDERPLLAGVAAGIAGVTLYLCIPAAAVLGIALAFRSRSSAVRFIAGGAPFALLLAGYQWWCFGSLLQTSVEGSGAFTQPGLWLGVFGRPSAAALWGLTFSQYRGLFFVSPVLLFAFFGAAIMIRRREGLRELGMIAGIVALFLFVVASFNGWHGGSAFGPRYLLSIVPLLAIPMLFAIRHARPLWVALAAISFAFQLIATSVDPMPNMRLARPLQTYLLPPLVTGMLPFQVARLLNRPPVVGFVGINEQMVDEAWPYQKHPPGSNETLWASFNLGELFFEPQSRASIVPIALWIVGGSVLLLRRAVREESPMAAPSSE
jgi:MFS family permease